MAGNANDIFRFREGDGPLLVSMPHVGTVIPENMARDMDRDALAVPDTDWHLDLLYDFLDNIGASVIMANHSRYVVDLNRSCDGGALYPGRRETTICPVDRFDGGPVYHGGKEVDRDEIKRRLSQYWQPYHDKISREVERIRNQYGYALLWDAHSIKSILPRFFSGRLPDLNLGTGDGVTCDLALSRMLFSLAGTGGEFTTALNGRFKGGYITRHYGNPADNIHAFQLEIAQATYMNEEAPYDFCERKAQKLRPILRKMMSIFSEFNPLEIS